MTLIQAMSRREALACTMAPLFVPRRVFGANDRINVGIIGTGGRGNLLIDQLPEKGQIIAASDCYFKRCQDAAAKRKANWKLYDDYRRLLDSKEVDAVIVATHDHGRVLTSIHACQAGKDVYAEKPLTVYIEEGRALVKAARKYKRVFQVGSQQRSMAMNRIACEFVRKGGLGKLKLVQGCNYTSAKRYAGLPEEAAPATLNWDVWQNFTAARPYNKKLHGGWMGWWDYSGGEMTNWGAHGLDMIQCALGMDGTGPVEWWPLEDGPKDSIGFRYANGVTVRLDLPAGPIMGGALFIGEKGRIEIIRNNFRTEPRGMIKDLPSREEVQKWRDEVALWQARYHMENWLDCIRTRATPAADVEIGHRSVSIAHLANITRQLGRKLEWNPRKERFVGDKEANRMVNRPRRRGYDLPVKA